MTSPHTPARTSAAFAATLALGTAFAVGPAATASAHDSLVSSDPAAGATLETAPDALTLTYSAEIIDQGSAATVTDAAGTDHVEGPLSVAGTTVTVPLDDLPAGAYDVTWRVVSSDGHPIDGTQSFTVTSDAVATPGATETAGATTSAPTAEVSDAATEAATAADPVDDETDTLSRWGLPLAAAAILATAVALLWRRNRDARDPRGRHDRREV